MYGRLQGFFKDNSELILQHITKGEAKEGTVNKGAKILLQKHLTHIFMKNEGYESVVQILDQMINYQGLIPFLFLSSFAHLQTAVYSCLSN
jgi:hypothetical protein